MPLHSSMGVPNSNREVALKMPLATPESGAAGPVVQGTAGEGGPATLRVNWPSMRKAHLLGLGDLDSAPAVESKINSGAKIKYKIIHLISNSGYFKKVHI